ncbi:alternative oxidase [Histoplasma capsulatum G186AR]|uniref:Alternative oxidase n=2 Tax=Ajellomyces capsulatus TaxID=5037 RepID=C0NCS0_AJECG|nr:alternative oxidase [Histoplasma capsulatum G186AR]EEH11461.1 alternative oxidase [Histoplasma capsulatum G186AR]KAG5302695.1 alternative oxidase [Histoplasma capsulatum]QSS71904.1 alternative oxidase [Histoplasma capsulatum G186AR]
MYPTSAGCARVLMACPAPAMLRGPLLRPSTTAIRGLRGSPLLYHYATTSNNNVRYFSSTSRRWIKEFFAPPKETDHIVESVTTWKHPVFTEKQMKEIAIAHREAKNWSDWVALGTVRFLRWATDLATGYRHAAPGKQGVEVPEQFQMTERKWVIRFIFLETVAGVPGMVGGMLRHLRSLRRMKRDNGWIETLLEEAYNERMHLLSFLKLAQPGWFMRLMVLGAQGVFFNGFFISYLISPRTCHRFVGYLEEEAVMTYTHAIKDLESGKLPNWANQPAPDIAVAYWQMPEGKRTILDLLYYIRADEAKHREVNHTLANLKQGVDPNPYASKYDNPEAPHPTKSAEIVKPTGWERDEVI